MKVKLYYISHTVGQGQALPKFISNSILASAPSLRGLSFFRKKMTEGEITKV